MNLLSPEKIEMLRVGFEMGESQRQLRRDTGISGYAIRHWFYIWTQNPDLAAERERLSHSADVSFRGPRGPYKARKQWAS